MTHTAASWRLGEAITLSGVRPAKGLGTKQATRSSRALQDHARGHERLRQKLRRSPRSSGACPCRPPAHDRNRVTPPRGRSARTAPPSKVRWSPSAAQEAGLAKRGSPAIVAASACGSPPTRRGAARPPFAVPHRTASQGIPRRAAHHPKIIVAHRYRLAIQHRARHL